MMDFPAIVQALSAHHQGDGPLRQALAYLSWYGWFNPARHAAANSFSLAQALEESLLAYQSALGLPASGRIDDQTLLAMAQPRCGCPDVLALGGVGKWHKNRLTWKVQSYLPGVAKDLQDDTFQTGLKSWSAVCDMTFVRVLANEHADLTVFAAPIDGPGNVLAQAQMPPGNDRPLWLQLDSTEAKWSMSAREQGMKLLNIFAHEVGHTLGLTHSQLNSALLFWRYSETISAPQERDDIPRVQALCGPPRTAPVPAPQPSPTPPAPGKPAPGKWWVRIESDAPIQGMRVFKGKPDGTPVEELVA